MDYFWASGEAAFDNQWQIGVLYSFLGTEMEKESIQGSVGVCMYVWPGINQKSTVI